MKRGIITGILIIGILCVANGQVVLSSEVISPLGGSASGSYGQYDYTIGQVVQETIQFPSNMVSQGFQQPAFDLRSDLDALVYCNGDSIHIPIQAIGYRSSGNTFTAELSDAAGLWSSPLLLGTATGTESMVLHAKLPFSLPAGSQYRVRVRSTLPFYKTIPSEQQQIDFCWIRLTVHALLEGMQQGDGTMVPLLYNLGLSDDPSAADSILISQMYAAPPYNDIRNFNTIIHTDGTAECLLPAVIYGPGGFYLRLRHRNGIEVWSKNLVIPFSQELDYSFME
ncbi:MAG: hypothetical protein ACKOQY_04425 [Bacteroidota bacterium]